MIEAVRRASRRAPLALRVALLTTTAVAMTFALFSTVVYVALRTQLEGALDDSMLRRTSAAVRGGMDVTRMGDTATALAIADIEIGLVRSGHLFESPNPEHTRILRQVAGLPEIEVSLGQRRHSARSVTHDGVRYRVVAVQADRGAALVMLQSMEPIDTALDHLGVVLLISGLAGMLAAGIVGWVVAANGLRPVRRLTEATERVARTTELTPIDVTGTDELARLGTSFNHMLAALGAAQERERQLVADAGHELRTPLTSLRTNIELLTQASHSEHALAASDRDELLSDVRAQIMELSTLVGDLVELARDEPMPVVPEEVDLRDVVESALERVRRRAPGVAFEIDAESWTVVGEPRTLERAVTNLLDNAAKWSPPGGLVRVRLFGGELTIADQGPGIEAGDMPHIFDRFYRADEARSLPGSGLGLSIVKRAAERHGGSVGVESLAGRGATFTLSIPGESGPTA